MKFSIGLIGAGNMGGALVKAAVKNGILQGDNLAILDVNAAAAQSLAEELRAHVADSYRTLVDKCNMLLIAVKPFSAQAVLDELAYYADTEKHSLLSIVTGLSTQQITEATGLRCMRVMPNTPALIGQGMSVYSTAHTLDDLEFTFATDFFAAAGETEGIGEEYFSAVTAVSGSGPAYVYMFIEAFSDAAVQQGLPRAVSYKLAAQTVLGAAGMVLQTQTHPAVLKDAVCTPAGTTIQALAALEQNGLRNAVYAAVQASAARAKALEND